MSLYDGRECPVCDGRTELKGQPCNECRARAVPVTQTPSPSLPLRAKTVREALLHLAMGLDAGTRGSRSAEQLQNCMLVIALKTLSNAPDELLGQLERLLK